MRRLIYDGDSVYELDEECLRRKAGIQNRKELRKTKDNQGPSAFPQKGKRPYNR